MTKYSERKSVKTILVVEDDGSVRRLLGRITDPKRYVCVLMKSIAELRQSCEKSVPAAVICEVRLPDGNGVEACVKLRERWPGLPIILMSGDILGTEAAQRAGFKSVLLKPFGVDKFISTLEREFRRS